MRVSIRGKTATVYKSDNSDEVVVIITDVNKEDLSCAYLNIDRVENIELEGIDKLELPEDFNIINNEGE